MSKVTPMMAQYLEIKSEAPDALLFYRMGDFYEMFFDDAVAAASALDIALTKRGKFEGNDIPMCGVPVHAAEGYFLTLIKKGFRVAVCEQLETPEQAKKRGGYKAVVKRGIVRLVTPGTLTEDSLLEARRHNYLAAYAELRGTGALAWVDISTGAMSVTPCALVKLGPELARLRPAELIINESHENTLREIAEETQTALTPLSNATFDSENAKNRICTLYGVADLSAFGAFERAEISALGALIDYLEITQRGKLPLLQKPKREMSQGFVQIDTATRRSLELTTAMNGGRAGSLLDCIDRTLTPLGARLLERRLSAPSTDVRQINARLDAVDWAVLEADGLKEELKGAPDIDRALSRLSLERGGPRDLAAIRNGLACAETLYQKLNRETLPDLLKEHVQNLSGHDAILGLLDSALVAEPPLMLRDGGVIAQGYDSELDETRTLRDEGRGVIAGMQLEYAERTGIQSLKIKHNNVLGYFIEVTATHGEKMLAREDFIHRQTTANQLRFTTVELSELETRIHNAGARALEIETRIFQSLVQDVLSVSDHLYGAARALAELDLCTALARLAQTQEWVRPIVDDSRDFEIKAGRHPVVEAALQKKGASFVSNDSNLSANKGASICLLTGPNMAGKSTYLRQNALIALLAQMGCFVPAQSAHIGVVSQLFSRVGASDDLARGRSTFMVEMVETAAILNQADDRALVILDEIGRGTATYDGLSIAWATLEHLHSANQCRALFATHYHEMTQLSDKLDGVRNTTVAVKEWKGDVIFLHEVVEGAADRSYGVQVAKLAGLPASVVTRADQVLKALEEGERKKSGEKAIIDDLPLFSAVMQESPKGKEDNAIVSKIAEIEPDSLSPRQALDLIYELKALQKESAS